MGEIEKFKVDRPALILSYITQFFQYGTSLVILPFILSYLSSKELGIWYIFLSVSSLANLIDFGFSNSLSRNVSFVFSGAKEILKDGNPTLSADKRLNYGLLKSLLYTSKLTYIKIAFVIFVSLATIGSYYILKATQDSGIDNILLLWICFAFSTAFNYYYGYVLIYIRGKGEISLSNIVTLLSRISYLLIVLVLIVGGFGLWALIIGNFVSALLSRFYGLYKFFNKELKNELGKVQDEGLINLFSIIWYNAKKFGISSFASFAFTHAVILISGAFLSLEEVAELGLIAQLSSVIVTIARVYFMTYYPKLCALWVTVDIRQIKEIFIKSQLVGYIIWIVSFSSLTFLGSLCLQLIHSNTQLPDYYVIGLYSLFSLMELTHGNCSMLISSRNTVPQFKASIVACVTAIMLMFVFVKAGMGIYSFPLAMISANLPYNSWKWPLYVYNMLKTN